jgi:hypothetical protein
MRASWFTPNGLPPTFRVTRTARSHSLLWDEEAGGKKAIGVIVPADVIAK